MAYEVLTADGKKCNFAIKAKSMKEAYLHLRRFHPMSDFRVGKRIRVKADKTGTVSRQEQERFKKIHKEWLKEWSKRVDFDRFEAVDRKSHRIGENSRVWYLSVCGKGSLPKDLWQRVGNLLGVEHIQEFQAYTRPLNPNWVTFRVIRNVKPWGISDKLWQLRKSQLTSHVEMPLAEDDKIEVHWQNEEDLWDEMWTRR